MLVAETKKAFDEMKKNHPEEFEQFLIILEAYIADDYEVINSQDQITLAQVNMVLKPFKEDKEGLQFLLDVLTGDSNEEIDIEKYINDDE